MRTPDIEVIVKQKNSTETATSKCSTHFEVQLVRKTPKIYLSLFNFFPSTFFISNFNVDLLETKNTNSNIFAANRERVMETLIEIKDDVRTPFVREET